MLKICDRDQDQDSTVHGIEQGCNGYTRTQAAEDQDCRGYQLDQEVSYGERRSAFRAPATTCNKGQEPAPCSSWARGVAIGAGWEAQSAQDRQAICTEVDQNANYPTDGDQDPEHSFLFSASLVCVDFDYYTMIPHVGKANRRYAALEFFDNRTNVDYD